MLRGMAGELTYNQKWGIGLGFLVGGGLLAALFWPSTASAAQNPNSQSLVLSPGQMNVSVAAGGGLTLMLPTGGEWQMDPNGSGVGPVEGLPNGASNPAAGTSAAVQLPVGASLTLDCFWQQADGTPAETPITVTAV